MNKTILILAIFLIFVITMLNISNAQRVLKCPQPGDKNVSTNSNDVVKNIYHESEDCTKYYECVNGKKIEKQCSTGQFFSVDSDVSIKF